MKQILENLLFTLLTVLLGILKYSSFGLLIILSIVGVLWLIASYVQYVIGVVVLFILAFYLILTYDEVAEKRRLLRIKKLNEGQS